MSLKHLQLHKIFKTSTANDTEAASTYCSHCQSSPLTLNSRRHCVPHLKKSAKRLGSSNTMLQKFLLIYALIFIIFSPLILCMQHQDVPIVSALSSATPSTNSIDVKSEIIIDDSLPEDDDWDDDRNYGAPSKDEVAEEYQKQFKAFAKKTQLKNEVKNSIATTVKPRRTTEGSCSSTACRARKDIEEASTESIRKHILMKLGMEHTPNITNYPKLTEEFLEHLCKKMNVSPENCLGKKPSNVEYQSDDPIDTHYEDYDDRDVVTAEEDVQFLSFENRIYAFPSTTVKPRHKSHLVYQFTESQEMNNVVSQATLNIFVYSKNYLRSTDVQLQKNARLIDIEIAKVLQGSQHKMIFETFRNISIPDGGNDGEYVQLNITDMVAEWFSSHETSHGLSVKIIASRTGAALPHKTVSLDAENFSTRPFIDILPRDQRKKRTKRSSLRCSKGSTESRCCRHDLTVDFDKFGWDWIIAPKKYAANYCAGECKIAFMQQYAHTHVMQLSTAANPCCSPRKMTPMQLLYFDSQLNIVLGTIPNMIVEECFCS